MSLTPEQKAAVEADGSVVVTAGAGTGKTHMLAERYVYHLAHDHLSPLQIVAVTFTEKAADELRMRIRRLIHERKPQHFDIISKLEAAQISTIHSLASRICREHFEKANVPPDFRILEEIENKLWITGIIGEAMHRIPSAIYEHIPYTLLRKALITLLEDPIAAERALATDNLNWPDLADEIRREAIRELLSSDLWQTCMKTLRSVAGQEKDKLELCRQDVLKAMAAIESSQNIDDSFHVLDQINLQGGSKKKWNPDEFDRTKAVLKDLRDCIRGKLKEGMINLQLSTVDDELCVKLDYLKQAYQSVYGYVSSAKWGNRVLDFPDLEVHALQALSDEGVRDYYKRRWKAFLIDEFQDTNPVQAELLEQLSGGAVLTIVGDKKQSIYGFRRADVSVFQKFSDKIILNGGKGVELDISFRTHRNLIENINNLFTPVLDKFGRNLQARRTMAPPEPHIHGFTIQAEEKINKPYLQQAEAYQISRFLKQLIDKQTCVFDKETGSLRTISYGDIAVLSRTWQPLDVYCETLEAEGLRTVHAGGGNLLETREAKDAWAMLRFLADPNEDLSLVAVLRSPWFAVSDKILFLFAQEHKQNRRWWTALKDKTFPELERCTNILNELLKKRNQEPPSRLLQLANRLTGYTAILANLPGAERRDADWRGFFELVQKLERGNNDVFTVIRHLKYLSAAGVELPRLPLEADNAISLMTVHAAKGLEWPVVVIPDLARESMNIYPPLYFDPDLGIGLKWEDQKGEAQEPVLFKVLKYQQKQRELAESKRLLYVAITRARDFLVMTSTHETGGSIDILLPGLQNAGVEITQVPFNPEDAIPPEPPQPPPLQEPPNLLLEKTGTGLFELPATALTEYAQCPKRFHFHFFEGHPGVGEHASPARRIGTLTHLALEYGIREADKLQPFDLASKPEEIAEAIWLAKRFDECDEYKNIRKLAKGRERPMMLREGSLVINGVADLLSHDFVLDFKTDRQMNPQHHRFQLWVYAKALKVKTAHIAYLRHDCLYTFSEQDLDECEKEGQLLLKRIMEDYTANPSLENCHWCPYAEICESCYKL